MSLRRKLALALVGGVAVSTFQVTPASAVCSEDYKDLTGDCNPCITVARVYHRATGGYMICPA